MAISKKVKDLVALALQDRVLTFKERQTIINAALKEGVAFEEIDKYINDALHERFKSYHKEQLTNCPKCGAPVPLIADECPFCGESLYHEESSEVKAVHVSGREAEIIRAENRKTAVSKQNRSQCECGAPLPLISNICPYCGRVFHEERDSEQNIKNLIAAMQQSISTLKGTLRPSFWLVLKYRLNVLCFYFAAVCLMMFVLLDIVDYLCVSLCFLLLSFIFLMFLNKDDNSVNEDVGYSCVKSTDGFMARMVGHCIDWLFHYLFGVRDKQTPIQIADDEFYKALYTYEKYHRQTDTIYGDSKEAKDLLAEYAGEIESYKKNRSKNRNILVLIFVVLMATPFYFYITAPSPAEQYSKNPSIKPEAYEMLGFSKKMQYTPSSRGADNEYFTVDKDVALKFDVIYEDRILLAQGDDVRYQMRLSSVNLLSTGKTTSRPDTCVLQAALLGKDGDIVGGELSPFKVIVRHDDDSYRTMFGKGGGHVYMDFVSKTTSSSAKRLREIADSAYFFTIF